MSRWPPECDKKPESLEAEEGDATEGPQPVERMGRLATKRDFVHRRTEKDSHEETDF